MTGGKRSFVAEVAMLAVLLLSPGASSHAQDAAPELFNLQESFTRIAEQVKPSVVNISAVHIEEYDTPRYEFYFGSPFDDFFDDFFGEQRLPVGKLRQQAKRRSQRRYEGIGSGVIIDAAGLILTNEHVVRGAGEIRVTMSDGRKYAGTVVGRDARTDLALLKIRAKGKLPSARLGDSEKIRVGAWAVAIGSPFGLEETVTAGIISAVRQSLVIEGRDYRDLLQTDAAINQGNSGGPLCDINGEVIGINTAIYAPTGVFSGIGFAVPSNSARAILSDLIHKGRVVRGWLGIDIRSIDAAVARQFRLPSQAGVLVNNVTRGSPADKAGIRRGDVVIRLGGKPVSDVRSLQQETAQAAPGTNIVVTVIRNGSPVILRPVVGEMRQDEEEARAVPEMHERADAVQGAAAEWEGVQLATLDAALARQYGIAPDEKGCIVLEIDEGTVASDAGFLPGDLIRSMNGMATRTIADFRTAVRAANSAGGIVFDVDRQGRPLYLSCATANR